MISYFQNNYNLIFTKFLETLQLSFVAIFLGCIIAIPLGIFLTRFKKLSKYVLTFTSLLQTIPSLALLAIMVPILGIGKTPAILALFIYSLLPILRNTLLGMESVNPELLDAAKGMGMSRFQIIYKVQLPIAYPIIISGVSLSCVFVLAWSTLASYIGGGGLGDLIFNGLNTYNLNMIIWGTIPITITSLILMYTLRYLESRGI